MSGLDFLFQRDYVAKADEHYCKGELQKAAELYARAGRHDQAADIFADLGDTTRAVESYRRARRPIKAAELLDRLGQHRNAVTYYEQAGAFRQAAEAALKTGQPERAGHNYEKASLYQRAAESFVEAGQHEAGLRAWGLEIDRLGQRDDAASADILQEIHAIEMLRVETIEDLGRYGEAAELLRRLGPGKAVRAARLFLRDKRFSEAAEAFLEANRVSEALEAVEQAVDTGDELRAAVYLRAGRYRDAGEILRRIGQLEEAAGAFERAKAWKRAAELFEQAEDPRRAAGHFFRAGCFEDAARLYAASDMHEETAAAFVKLHRYDKAAEAYLKADMLLHAGNYYLKAHHKKSAFVILQRIPPEAPTYLQASMLLIPLLLDRGLMEGAEYRLDGLRKARIRGETKVPAYMRWYLQGRVEEAKGLWRKAVGSYERVLSERDGFRDAAERLESARARDAGFREPRPQPLGESPTGTISVELLLEPPGTLPDLSGQPFAVRRQLEPWWHGVSVCEAVDRRGNAPRLMVAFPQSFAGTSVEDLNHGVGEHSGLSHESVLTLHGAVLAQGTVLLLYEPFDGRTLAERLAEDSLSHATGLGILRQLANALATAHNVGIVHQWLSPRTLLIDDGNRVKLTGLGLPPVFARHDDESRVFLSPEIREGKKASPASDLFSLGRLGVELLQAYLPVDQSPSAFDSGGVSWPPEAEAAVPRAVRELLLRCLCSNPFDRPSAAQLESALGEVGFLPGQVLLDRFEVLDELGRGGMSRVYRAYDRQLDEKVAIKTMINLSAESSQDRERLFREVQICRKISHPNVVRVHDFGQIPGGIFVIMELLDGPGLDQVIDSEAPLSLERVRDLLREIAAALGEAHHRKVIHRDLKPGNVMLVEGRAKVIDFGIAHINDRQLKQLTQTGELMGSPLYMSPERIEGRPLEATCDLYALGAIAYKMLTGREPFQAETMTAVVFKQLNEAPPDIRRFRPDIPDVWVDVLDKLLAKFPGARFQSAEELIRVLSSLPVE